MRHRSAALPPAATTGGYRWWRGLITALLATTMLVVAACGGGADGPAASVTLPEGDGYHGSLLDEPYDVPDVVLQDTSSHPFELAKQTSRLQLVFFGYTNCPDICQIVMSTIASGVVRLDAELRDEVDVIFVTTDPARDDQTALRIYLDRFNPDFEGLTGSLDDISQLAAALKVFFEEGQQLPTGGYEVDHATYVFGVQDGQAHLVWTQGTSAAQFAEDIRHFLA